MLESIRLDVYVEDEQGRMYDLEMQCSNGADGELAKRTRYYQAMIDMELLEKGHDYTELNPAYIIFICTFDAFKEGLPMYTFRSRCIEKDGLELGDESTKIFLNSKGAEKAADPDIAAFLRYVDGKAAEGLFVQTLDEEVQRVKRHDETRREYMTLAMELKRQNRAGYLQGKEEGIELGIAQGMELGEAQGVTKNRLETALAMLQDGVPLDLITKYTALSSDDLVSLAKEYHIE